MMYWIHRTSTQTISTVYLGLQLPPFSWMEEPEHADNNARFKKSTFKFYCKRTFNLYKKNLLQHLNPINLLFKVGT